MFINSFRVRFFTVIIQPLNLTSLHNLLPILNANQSSILPSCQFRICIMGWINVMRVVPYLFYHDDMPVAR